MNQRVRIAISILFAGMSFLSVGCQDYGGKPNRGDDALRKNKSSTGSTAKQQQENPEQKTQEDSTKTKAQTEATKQTK